MVGESTGPSSVGVGVGVSVGVGGGGGAEEEVGLGTLLPRDVKAINPPIAKSNASTTNTVTPDPVGESD